MFIAIKCQNITDTIATSIIYDDSPIKLAVKPMSEAMFGVSFKQQNKETVIGISLAHRLLFME